MSIQDRLRRDRYSEQNIRLNYRDIQTTVGRTKPYFTNYFSGKDSQLDILTNKILQLYSNPTVKDRYYNHNLSQIVKDYNEIATQRAKRFLVLNCLIKPTVYYILNQHIYQTFEHIGISIINYVPFHMRKYILKVRGRNKLIPILYDRTSSSSAMYYPLYKPMGLKANGILRDNIFNLIYDFCLLYIKHNKITI